MCLAAADPRFLTLLYMFGVVRATVRVFQGILGTFRAENRLNTLAVSQRVKKGGRSLLAKVCKLRNNLEGVSLTMNRRVFKRGGRRWRGVAFSIFRYVLFTPMEKRGK